LVTTSEGIVLVVVPTPGVVVVVVADGVCTLKAEPAITSETVFPLRPESAT
jgi:hypothetical protein